MQSLTLRPTETENNSLDLAREIMRLETLLAEQRSELVSLQEELRVFKARYTQIVGSRVAELADIERAIKKAEAHLFGVEDAPEEEDGSSRQHNAEAHGTTSVPVKAALRKLFWSIAKVFHPDHAADESEAQRRHTIMAEASRAYTEGDIESLHTLLGDEHLQSYCASGSGGAQDEEINPANRLLGLKDELRTIEFGIKRIEQDTLYQLKLSCDAEAARNRDALAAMSERIARQIVKARHRLEHVS
ncbi:MAG: hypothetical protein ACR2LC_01375 [Pyrinomonadaceae bacterium]